MITKKISGPDNLYQVPLNAVNSSSGRSCYFLLLKHLVHAFIFTTTLFSVAGSFIIVNGVA